DKVQILSPHEFKARVSAPNIQLIDVRTAVEYNKGHIENAVNIDFYSGTFYKEMEKQMVKSKAIYLYCRSGVRSRRAARKLAKMNFDEIYDLKGGILGWK
ncbi:MAG: rhodanese-like domain-containing protein, partial [Bacteroidia bacterium]|nr:rhodanese-like domain-containing protein [Bacteroidia bacterium]